jgi:hypothetical protein
MAFRCGLIEVGQVRDRWRVFVKMTMNFLGSITGGEFLTV